MAKEPERPPAPVGQGRSWRGGAEGGGRGGGEGAGLALPLRCQCAPVVRQLGLWRLSGPSVPLSRRLGQSALDLEAKLCSLKLPRQMSFLLPAVKLSGSFQRGAQALAEGAEVAEGTEAGGMDTDRCLQQGQKELCTVVDGRDLQSRCSLKTFYLDLLNIYK